ncbi:hypothetical protein CYMTET_56949 [Cymbomonas tetramitiformis]|uniref:Uncharacterized protein n=1 Tax=Cymbomonas tetramitiformis TaxID=36881 RepID=A0AAE0B9W6_9CHLO|nr:hypothetical protein CYMTET_56949 [Cymbomonas tetramitiformis]
MPHDSPGRKHEGFIGHLFRPVTGEWCGHTMNSMPPAGIVASDGAAASFLWMFYPMILGTVGWESAFPIVLRGAEWSHQVEELRKVLRNARVTWEVVAGYILQEGLAPFHFSRQSQKELIGRDTHVGRGLQSQKELIGRDTPVGRGLHS